MHEGRLFKILYYLLDKGSATAPELAERFEVSVRTIHRDIDALSSSGIPIYTETGRYGGIRLMSDFVLNKIVISDQEKQEILSALQGLEVVNNGYKKDTLEKLSALFRVHSVDWLEVDFSRWGDNPRDSKKFEVIKTAIIHNRCITISYVGSHGKESERTIEPLKLFYKSKDWYLKAYCRLREDFRIFKISRILKWELLENRFQPKTFPEVSDRYQQTYNRITLRFHEKVAYRVYDEFDINQIRLEKNGSLLVTAYMPEDEWLIGYLLTFGVWVEIIEPAYLKKILAARAKEIYENNKA